MAEAEGKPVRVQLSRRKGWRMPPNTVTVARPGSPLDGPCHADVLLELANFPLPAQEDGQ